MTSLIVLRLQGLKDLAQNLCGERASINWLSLSRPSAVKAFFESNAFKTKYPNGATMQELLRDYPQFQPVQHVLSQFLAQLVAEHQLTMSLTDQRYKAIIQPSVSKPSCHITGTLGSHCQVFYRQVCEILDSNTTCIDYIYSSLNDIMVQMSTAVAESAKKPPQQGNIEQQGNTLSLNILARAFDDFVEEVVKMKLSIATLGSSVEPVTNKGLTFANVAGLTFEKNQIQSGFIRPLQFPNLFRNRKRGMVLWGTGGGGKTTLVSAMVNEVPKCVMFSPQPGSLRSEYVGKSARNIHALFTAVSMYLDKHTSEYKFAIIFIDEIDELTKARSSSGSGGGAGGGSDDTVFALLQMMDGVYADPRISVVGATNLLDSMDGAILRRLPLKVFIGLPTRKAREFAIRNALQKEFSLPNTCDKDLVYKATDPPSTQANPAHYMYNIATYSYMDRNDIPPPKEGMTYSPVRLVDYLTDDDINILVDLTGPRVDAEPEYKGRLPKTEFVNAVIPSAPNVTRMQSKYGLSIADLNSYMEDVINCSRERTLGIGAVLDPFVLNKLACKNDKSVKPEKVYIYNPNYLTKDTKRSEAWFNDPEIASNIVSFDITMNDFLVVFQKYLPSTSEADYTQYLKKL